MVFVLAFALFPLAAYCCILALMNRRGHPVMVSGPWDFAGVLFAVSGFLLLLGPFILNSFNQSWRDLWLRAPWHSSWGLSDEWWYLRLSFCVLYFLIVAGGSFFLLRKRGRFTSIYNVDPSGFEEALARVLDRLRLNWLRAGNRIFIGFHVAPGDPGLARGEFSPDPGGSSGSAPNQKTVLELDPFPAMRHVSLRWPQSAGALRKEIEVELAKVLPALPAPDNPAAMWFTSIGVSLFCLVFFAILALILLQWLRH